MPNNKAHKRTIQLYRSAEHPCAYLDNQSARTLFVNPESTPDMALYSTLIDQGFRRSGNLIYRPDCPHCQQCISLRVPINTFSPRRSQRRIWRQNKERFRVEEQPVGSDPEHFRLFERYIAARHPDGEMANTSQQEYQQFLSSDWSNTRSFAFYDADMLVAVAVSDILPQGLSAVYTFFDPQYEKSSPGVYTILWQIEECRRRNLPWLYLGYWIESCHKMAYKREYLPHEAFIDNHWARIERRG